MASYSTDKKQLLDIGKSLLAARTSSEGSSSSDDYYRARKDYERERLKTSIMAPLVGGILGDLISAPFREPLMDFQATEKGAKLYSDYKQYSEDFNSYDYQRQEIRRQGITPEQYFMDNYIENKNSIMENLHGENWRDDPRVEGAYLSDFQDEARTAVALDLEQYAKADAMFSSGYMTPQEFQARVERYNPLPSGPGQAFTRWIGRNLRGESKEEYTNKMINQITGGPDSPLGIDHNLLTELVNDAIFIDNKVIADFKNQAIEHYNENIAHDEALKRNMLRSLWEQNRELRETYDNEVNAGRANSAVAKVIFDLMQENSRPENLNETNFLRKLSEFFTLPTLSEDERGILKTAMASMPEWAETRSSLQEFHPLLTNEDLPESDRTQAGATLGSSLDNQILDRAILLAEKAMETDQVREVFEGYTTESEKKAFAMALVERQLPTVYAHHLETYEEMESGGWFRDDVIKKIYTGQVTPITDISAIEETTIDNLEAVGQEPFAFPPDIVINDLGTAVKAIQALDYSGLSDQEAFDKVNEAINAAVADLGGNPFIAPPQDFIDSRTKPMPRIGQNFLSGVVASSIIAHPFGTQSEEFDTSDGNTVRITYERRGEGTAEQINISTYEKITVPTGLYEQETDEEVVSESDITFDELPEDSAFRRNAMFDSEQYMKNEEELIALGVSPGFLQEAYYRDHPFFAAASVDLAKEMQADPTYFNAIKQVAPEDRERATELFKANQDILDKFDFSRVPFRTVKKHADQFLRDANEAYKLLDIEKPEPMQEEWVEGQIDEAGNVMSPPSLLEPDFEDASSEAKAVQNLLTERYNFIEDDIGNPLREEAIAALMGNIHVETGGSFDYRQLQNQGPAYGLFQFDDKKANYDAWLVENNKQDSASSQIDFVYDTIYGDSQDIIGVPVASRLRDVFETGTVEEITAAFSLLWERPNPQKANQDRRIEEANKYFSIFSP